MSFIDLAEKRFSVRSFKDADVDEKYIAKILEAARIAPTAANRQSQRIMVIRGKNNVARLSECTKYTFSAPLLFIICYDRSASWKRKFDGHDEGEIDAAIVTTHMMLEAADIGLGTTWVGYFDPAKLREIVSLDENIIPVALLPTGWPAEGLTPSALHTDRKDIKDLLLDTPEDWKE